MSLTDDWKNGKLKRPNLFYIRGRDKDVLIAKLANDNRLYSVDSPYFEYQENIEVLAPCDYEVLQRIKISEKMCIDDYKRVVDECERLKKEVKKLRQVSNKNIYTILDKIKFEERVEGEMKMIKECENTDSFKVVLSSLVFKNFCFGLVSDFYMELVDNDN